VGNRVMIGALLCFIAAASWGAMFPVAHSAFQYIDPFYFTVFRYGSVAVILAALLLWKEGARAFRLEGRGLSLWFFGTMAFTVYNLLIFWGEDLLGEPGVMSASIMESLMPMISILIGRLLFRKGVHRFTLVCVLASFIGAVLVITKGDFGAFAGTAGKLGPTALLFLAVVGWVIYTMGAEKFTGWSALRYSTLTCLLGTGTAIIITIGTTLAGYTAAPTFDALMDASPHLIFMIVFPGLIALLGWNAGVAILSPLNGLLFINIVPVTTLAVSVLQGYHVTAFDLIGTALIIASLLSNNLFVRMTLRAQPHHRHQKRQRTLLHPASSTLRGRTL